MQSVTGRYRNLSLFLSWWILQWLYSGAWCCGEFMNDHVQALHILLNSCVMGWINHDCALQIYYRILYCEREKRKRPLFVSDPYAGLCYCSHSCSCAQAVLVNCAQAPNTLASLSVTLQGIFTALNKRPTKLMMPLVPVIDCITDDFMGRLSQLLILWHACHRSWFYDTVCRVCVICTACGFLWCSWSLVPFT